MTYQGEAMKYETIELVVNDDLARLTLNQPDLGNPFNAVFCGEFGQVANELAGRADVRVVLLCARGNYFSVGGDIALFSHDLDAMPNAVREGTAGLHMGMARLMRLNAPIVACIHGAAMGGAVAVLFNCDLIYSARSARLGAAYSQIGFTCDLGASFGLASRMGLARARRFLLLGEVLDAASAERTGLVDHVVDDAEVSATPRMPRSGSAGANAGIWGNSETDGAIPGPSLRGSAWGRGAGPGAGRRLAGRA